jgi:hypothetical protein
MLQVDATSWYPNAVLLKQLLGRLHIGLLLLEAAAWTKQFIIITTSQCMAIINVTMLLCCNECNQIDQQERKPLLS